MLAKNSLFVDPSGIFETKQSPFTISTTCAKQIKMALNKIPTDAMHATPYHIFRSQDL